MKIYHYNEISGEFLAEGAASLNPRDPANPMIPAYASVIPPLKQKAGFTSCFNLVKNGWEYQADNRGTWFKPTGEQVNIIELGIVDPTWSKTAPLPVPPTPRELVLAEIHSLEASITNRRLREAVLGTDNGWLAGIDAQIAVLRAGLV